MTFLIEQLKKLSSRHQVMLSRLLLGLFRQAMHERHDGPYDHDKPAPVTVPARHAAYSANLVLLIALISGEVTARQLFPESSDPVKQWWTAPSFLETVTSGKVGAHGITEAAPR